MQYFAPEPPEAVDRGFHVERRYERYVKDGTSPAAVASSRPQAAATSFDAGDLIRVTVAVTIRGEGRYLALTDPLPAGFEPLEGWFQTTVSDLAREATRTSTDDNWAIVVAARRFRSRREARRPRRRVRDAGVLFFAICRKTR